MPEFAPVTTVTVMRVHSTRVFDDEVDRAAAPDAVRALLATLADRTPDEIERLRRDDALREAVIAVSAASRSLSRVILTDPRAIDALADPERRVPRPVLDGPDPAADLARWKRIELLRIAARDLTGVDDLRTTGRLLADLADEVLIGAAAIAGVAAAGVAVVAMGKAGAQELNYASDVDVLFVGEGDARRLLAAANQSFRIDADLRPEGRDGPLVRTLEAFEAYWDRWAETWEFQALLKARAVCGPRDLQEGFTAAATSRVWSRPFGAEELRTVRAMKARTELEVARQGLTSRELKRGRGGIRDIEFSVQLLQLVHGRSDPALRLPATLDALAELAAAGYVAPADADAFAQAYTFLRVVEHRLQLVEEQQVHALPANPRAVDQIARTMGYRDDERSTALGRFEEDLVRHQAVARSIHERLFFRPLLEAFTTTDGPLTQEAAHDRLVALGFTDAGRTRAAVQELTRGLSRGSRLLAALLPALLGWLSEAPDPDLGLLGLRQLATGPHRSARLSETFRESPEAARRLCTVIGTSRLLTQTVERQPDLMGWLADDAQLAPHSRDALVERATAVFAIRNDDERVTALQRFRQAETWRIAAADLVGRVEPAAVEHALTDLAEAVLEAALAAAAPGVPVAVVAMGRLGGSELSYSSDLDVVLFHDERGPGGQTEAEATAERFLRILRGRTPAQRVWDVDLDLRPEGKQGRLATSIPALEQYLDTWAQTWERQALVRARPSAGDRAVGGLWAATVEPWVWQRPLTAEEAREIRRMKARIERERIPAGEDRDFHLKLGRGSLSDVEWTTQLLQLQHGVRGTSTQPALRALTKAGAIAERDAEILAETWRFCEVTRNRWFLIKGTPSDALPAHADELTRLARSLETTADGLRDQYRKRTRRTRAIVERVFYGT
jgi:glutamate-ammonia-ligase adenylyltransferase